MRRRRNTRNDALQSFQNVELSCFCLSAFKIRKGTIELGDTGSRGEKRSRHLTCVTMYHTGTSHFELCLTRIWNSSICNLTQMPLSEEPLHYVDSAMVSRHKRMTALSPSMGAELSLAFSGLYRLHPANCQVLSPLAISASAVKPRSH